MAGEEELVARYTGYDTFEEAMLAHASSGDIALSWNDWQKEAAVIAAVYGDTAPPPGQTKLFSELRVRVNSFAQCGAVLVRGQQQHSWQPAFCTAAFFSKMISRLS